MDFVSCGITTSLMGYWRLWEVCFPTSLCTFLFSCLSCLLTLVFHFVICKIGLCTMGCVRTSLEQTGRTTTPPRIILIGSLMIGKFSCLCIVLCIGYIFQILKWLMFLLFVDCLDSLGAAWGKDGRGSCCCLESLSVLQVVWGAFSEGSWFNWEGDHSANRGK